MIRLEDAVVLLVEDNPDNLLFIIDLLQDMPIQYCNARASGRQLFKLVEQLRRRIDLILLDIQIPYEDGYTILKQIRMTPALAKTKVVAVTANVMQQDVDRARTAGFDGFIGKPISVSQFPNQVRRILEDEEVWEP